MNALLTIIQDAMTVPRNVRRWIGRQIDTRDRMKRGQRVDAIANLRMTGRRK